MPERELLKCDERGLPEWMSFQMAWLWLVTAGACDTKEHPTLLVEWAAEGKLRTQARMLFVNGELQRNGAIPPLAWKQAKQEGGIDWEGGHFKSAGTFAPEGTEQLSVVAREVFFNFDDFKAVLPMDEEHAWEAAERMRELRVESEAAQLDRPPVDALKSRVGRKPDAARWQAFYFAVIELAKDGRLTADHFNSAAALSEEIQLMMGDGAFSPDHTKTVVGQVFKRFCS